MILTERGEFIQGQLLKIIPGNRHSQHLLLQAYLTVMLTKEYDRTALKDYLLESLFDPVNLEIRRLIESYSLADYLMYVASFEVADLKSFMSIKIHNSRDATDVDRLVSLLIVKDFEFTSITSSHSSIRNLYSAYQAKARSAGIHYIDDRDGSFIRFLQSVYSYHLSTEFTKINENADRCIRKIVGIMYDDFRQTRAEAFHLCSFVHSQDFERAKDIEPVILALVKNGKFWNTSIIARNEKAAGKGFIDLENSMIEVDGVKMTPFVEKVQILAEELFEVTIHDWWYELSCGLYIYQRRSLDVRSDDPTAMIVEELANDVERPNDVALEMSLLHQILFQNKRLENKYLIIFPSPYLVKEIVKRKDLEKITVKFILEDDGLKEMTDAWVFDPILAAKTKKVRKEHITIEAYHDGSYGTDSYRNIDASGFTDILVEDIQSFGKNDISYRQGLLNIVETVDGGSRLTVVCRDSEMRGSTAIFPRIRKDMIKGIYVLPTKTVGTQQKKDIFIADFISKEEVSGDVKLNVYELVRSELADSEKHRRLFIDYCSPSSINYSQYINSWNPLRKTLKKTKQVVPDADRRNPARYFAFCPEITFKYYEFSKSGSPGSVYYVVYFIDGDEAYGKTTNFKAKTLEDFRKWLKNDYIYKKVRVNEGTRKKEDADNVPRSGSSADEYNKQKQTYAHWIRDVIGCQYQRVNITLRAFWCFNPDIKTQMRIGDEGYEILKQLVQSDIGEVYLSEISAERILEVLSENELLEEIDETYIFDLLSRVLAIAVKNGNILHNPLSDDDGEEYSSRNVRNALARRTLSEAKFRQLFDMLNPKEGEVINPENLALLMRLLTGISTPEVVALKWSDFLSIEEFSLKFHALRISKRLSSGSNEPENHSKATCYRILPLGRYLGEILEKYHQALGGVDDGDRFILSKNGTYPMSTKSISLAFLKCFKRLNVPEIQIRIPKGNVSGFEEVILTRSFGDLLRENLRFWAIKVAGFNSDEISSLFGTSRVTTFGKYYMDYNNEQSLCYTFEKLNRIEAFLLYGGIRDRIENRNPGSDQRHISYTTFSPIRIDLQFNMNSSSAIDVSSTFGARVTEMKPFSDGVEEKE